MQAEADQLRAGRVLVQRECQAPGLHPDDLQSHEALKRVERELVSKAA